MPVASLTDVLVPARAGGRAVMGAVVLGWEDAEAYVAAAEQVGCRSFFRPARNFARPCRWPFPV